MQIASADAAMLSLVTGMVVFSQVLSSIRQTSAAKVGKITIQNKKTANIDNLNEPIMQCKQGGVYKIYQHNLYKFVIFLSFYAAVAQPGDNTMQSAGFVGRLERYAHNVEVWGSNPRSGIIFFIFVRRAERSECPP
jgi:hypothetical protein